MTLLDIQSWALANQTLAAAIAAGLAVLAFLFTRLVVARVVVNLVARTKTSRDDVVIKYLHPYRVAWIAPLLVIFALAPYFPDAKIVIEKISLLGVTWLTTLTLYSLLDAVNTLYESSKNYRGVAIQGYLDIVKMLFIVAAIILSIALLTGQSPWGLLTGLGALTAILLLIFQNTILSLVASIQIVANDLLKEGDWIEVPSYDADGDVVNINLHTIKVRNFDMTYAVIPTYKIVDVAYKNWRGMTESGTRRIQRSVTVDMISIKFCDDELLTRLAKIDLIRDFIESRQEAIASYRQHAGADYDSPLDGPQITNVEVFRRYIIEYLKRRDDILQQEGVPFLVRSLEPKPNGLAIELYIFAKTIDWGRFEAIQAEIFDHLLAAAPSFDLRVFQEPTGMDFKALAERVSSK
jgi:miniconductance mechanosensitive channel